MWEYLIISSFYSNKLFSKLFFVVLEIFHKYDGFVYPKRGWVRNFFFYGSEINDRREFFRNFFPKWSGFYVDSFDDKIQLVEALERLQCLVNGTTSVWTSTSGNAENHPIDSQKLKLEEVGTV